MVNGTILLNVSVPVTACKEDLSLLEVNYQYDPNRIIAYELVAVDCKGIRHKMTVNDCDEMILNEYVY
jgi:hypothetical protein